MIASVTAGPGFSNTIPNSFSRTAGSIPATAISASWSSGKLREKHMPLTSLNLLRNSNGVSLCLYFTVARSISFFSEVPLK
jgi:hypothetical protein